MNIFVGRINKDGGFLPRPAKRCRFAESPRRVPAAAPHWDSLHRRTGHALPL